MEKSPAQVIRRQQWLRRFWMLNYVICVGLYLWAYGLKFDGVGIFILYVALLTVYDSYEAATATEQAARAQEVQGAEGEEGKRNHQG